MVLKTFLSATALSLVTTIASAAPVTFEGIEFPGGLASFADSIVSFTPGSPAATAANAIDPDNILNAPDYSGTSTDTFLSLGNGGSVTLEFVDNALSGSGSTAGDLFVFEIGPAVEATNVEISQDGVTFFSVGQVAGATSIIDIDVFGFGIDDLFSFVRLTDVAGQDGTTGSTVGADIDAVGAITSVAPPVSSVPLPAAGWLLLAAIGGFGALRRPKRA